jgi:hypothetical protein
LDSSGRVSVICLGLELQLFAGLNAFIITQNA